MYLLDSHNKSTDSAGTEEYQPWIALLPSPVDSHLPITSFTEEEMLACQDAEAIREAQGIRRMLSSACEVRSICFVVHDWWDDFLKMSLLQAFGVCQHWAAARGEMHRAQSGLGYGQRPSAQAVHRHFAFQ